MASLAFLAERCSQLDFGHFFRLAGVESNVIECWIRR
jgi:hypothetical protein